ncbi:MAG: diguanylate cyclase [Deltaproteobacteria bacterium]|jgi:two-component system cell cycle response regulator|nr:diguanylate cyclase [Deltaproteobacteria bacterium]MBW2529865.1 diguanylate cyclase [Deltaproteobacteria bacterium]
MQSGGSRHRILVVDDSAVHRSVVRGILTPAGYEIAEATDGLDGITQTLSLLPDLVISDVVMPDVNGYLLCRFLKHDRATAEIPIILMTATEISKQHRFWGLRSGADRYVVKAEVGDTLLGHVQSLLGSVAPGAAWARGARATHGPRGERNVRAEIAGLLDGLLFRTTIAQEVRKLSTFVHDASKCFAELAALANDLADHSCLCLHLAGLDGSRLHLAARSRLSPAQLQQAREAAAERFGRGDPLEEVAGMLDPPAAELVDPASSAGRFASSCSFPLLMHLGTLGSLSVFFDRSTAMTSEVREQMRTLAHEFTPIARLVILCRETQQLSVADSLTLLYSQRHFKERLATAVDGHRQYGRAFAVVVLDVDHFKQVNDYYGHAAGDVVLRQLANALRASARPDDVIARLAADSFGLLLPDVGVREGLELAEQIRLRTEAATFGDTGAPLRITVSAGVSEPALAVADGSGVLDRAQQALDEARASGGNAARSV